MSNKFDVGDIVSFKDSETFGNEKIPGEFKIATITQDKLLYDGEEDIIFFEKNYAPVFNGCEDRGPWSAWQLRFVRKSKKVDFIPDHVKVGDTVLITDRGHNINELKDIIGKEFVVQEVKDLTEEEIDHDYFFIPTTQHIYLKGRDYPVPLSNAFVKLVKEADEDDQREIKYGDYYVNEFKVGDKVTWRNDHYAELTNGRKRFGNGPFEVVHVQSKSEDQRGSAGHIQGVMIKTKTYPQPFSGAYFVKVKDDTMKQVFDSFDTWGYKFPKVQPVAKDVVAGQQSKIDKQSNVIRGMQGKITRQAKEINDLQNLRMQEAEEWNELVESHDDYGFLVQDLETLVADQAMDIRDLLAYIRDLESVVDQLQNDEYDV